jgi:hypothetical protein
VRSPNRFTICVPCARRRKQQDYKEKKEEMEKQKKQEIQKKDTMFHTRMKKQLKLMKNKDKEEE